jgi:hypothetical protein
VLESTRREEERVRRETAEGLLAFRQRQEEADKKLLQSQQGDAASPVEEGEEEWAAAGGARKRKRKAGNEKEILKGVKLRRSSTSASDKRPSIVEDSGVVELATSHKTAMDAATKGKGSGAITTPDLKSQVKPVVSPPSQTKHVAAPAAKGGLGLVDYGSDSDDD